MGKEDNKDHERIDDEIPRLQLHTALLTPRPTESSHSWETNDWEHQGSRHVDSHESLEDSDREFVDEHILVRFPTEGSQVMGLSSHAEGEEGSEEGTSVHSAETHGALSNELPDFSSEGPVVRSRGATETPAASSASLPFLDDASSESGIPGLGLASRVGGISGVGLLAEPSDSLFSAKSILKTGHATASWANGPRAFRGSEALKSGTRVEFSEIPPVSFCSSTEYYSDYDESENSNLYRESDELHRVNCLGRDVSSRNPAYPKESLRRKKRSASRTKVAGKLHDKDGHKKWLQHDAHKKHKNLKGEERTKHIIDWYCMDYTEGKRKWYYHRIFRSLMILPGLLFTSCYWQRCSPVLAATAAEVEVPVLGAIPRYAYTDKTKINDIIFVRSISERVGEALGGLMIDAILHEQVTIVAMILSSSALQMNTMGGSLEVDDTFFTAQHCLMGIASSMYIMAGTVLAFDWPHIMLGIISLQQALMEIASLHGYDTIQSYADYFKIDAMSCSTIMQWINLLSGCLFLLGITLSIVQYERSETMRKYFDRLMNQGKKDEDNAGATSWPSSTSRPRSTKPGSVTPQFSKMTTQEARSQTRSQRSKSTEVRTPRIRSPRDDEGSLRLRGRSVSEGLTVITADFPDEERAEELSAMPDSDDLSFFRRMRTWFTAVSRFPFMGYSGAFGIWYFTQTFTINVSFLTALSTILSSRESGVLQIHSDVNSYIFTLVVMSAIIVTSFGFIADLCKSGFIIIVTVQSLGSIILIIMQYTEVDKIIVLIGLYVLKYWILIIHRVIALMSQDGRGSNKFGSRCAILCLLPGILADLSSSALANHSMICSDDSAADGDICSRSATPKLNQMTTAIMSYINIVISILYPLFLWHNHRRDPIVFHPKGLFHMDSISDEEAPYWQEHAFPPEEEDWGDGGVTSMGVRRDFSEGPSRSQEIRSIAGDLSEIGDRESFNSADAEFINQSNSLSLKIIPSSSLDHTLGSLQNSPKNTLGSAGPPQTWNTSEIVNSSRRDPDGVNPISGLPNTWRPPEGSEKLYDVTDAVRPAKPFSEDDGVVF